MTICMLCGAEEEFMIYEVINVARGGEVVGHLCKKCGEKASV